MKFAMVVYQAGIANVFKVEDLNHLKAEGRKACRLMQASFSPCEYFARGLWAAGVEVRSVHANVAGDVALHDWSGALDEALFRENFRPVGHFWKAA